MVSSRLVVAAFAGFATISFLCGVASAQTPAPPSVPSTPVQPQPRDPHMPAPQNTVPEKIDGSGATGTLSEKLQKTDGVITPPTNVDPGIAAKPPVSDPGTTPVIRPPGSPGGDQSVTPK